MSICLEKLPRRLDCTMYKHAADTMLGQGWIHAPQRTAMRQHTRIALTASCVSAGNVRLLPAGPLAAVATSPTYAHASSVLQFEPGA